MQTCLCCCVLTSHVLQLFIFLNFFDFWYGILLRTFTVIREIVKPVDTFGSVQLLDFIIGLFRNIYIDLLVADWSCMCTPIHSSVLDYFYT